MSDVSSILSLPYIQASQAQKHVTHNEALRVLDMLVQLVVEDIDATAPPALPSEGDIHALGSGATGDWAGQDGDLAAWIDSTWTFITPLQGWCIYNKADGSLRAWSGSAWLRPIPEFDNLTGVGVQTTSDSTNRLAVQSPAVLFSHDGAGHQVKVNKATISDTASLLFQTNWSGRAELGLAGDDDLTIKVSDDGSTWTTALAVLSSNGRIGMGTATPGTELHLVGDNSPEIRVEADGFDTATLTAKGRRTGTDTDIAELRFINQENTAGSNGSTAGVTAICKGVGEIEMLFETATGGARTEAFRLQPDGAVSGLRAASGAAPSSPVAGQIYFDDTTSKLRCWDGSAWQDLF